MSLTVLVLMQVPNQKRKIFTGKGSETDGMDVEIRVRVYDTGGLHGC